MQGCLLGLLLVMVAMESNRPRLSSNCGIFGKQCRGWNNVRVGLGSGGRFPQVAGISLAISPLVFSSK